MQRAPHDQRLDAQHLQRPTVGGADGPGGVQAQHTHGHRFEQGLDVAATGLQIPPVSLDLLGHAVERGCELRDFVVSRFIDPVVQVASRQGLGTPRQLQNRIGDFSRQVEAGPDTGKNHQQGEKREESHVEPLHGRAGAAEIHHPLLGALEAFEPDGQSIRDVDLGPDQRSPASRPVEGREGHRSPSEGGQAPLGVTHPALAARPLHQPGRQVAEFVGTGRTFGRTQAGQAKRLSFRRDVADRLQIEAVEGRFELRPDRLGLGAGKPPGQLARGVGRPPAGRAEDGFRHGARVPQGLFQFRSGHRAEGA
ncbi:MAG: hypothetical protein Q9Q13_09515 [Acidobacteriota bacterium]|nr:hypothetical protein [Acidobacteriota bacterium]